MVSRIQTTADLLHIFFFLILLSYCIDLPKGAVGQISICPTGTVHYRKSRALHAAQIKNKKKKRIFIIDMNPYARELFSFSLFLNMQAVRICVLCIWIEPYA